MMHWCGVNCCGGGELVGINYHNWTAKDYLLTYVDETSLHRYTDEAAAWAVISYAWDVGAKGDGRRTQKQGTKRFREFKNLIESNGLGHVQVMRKSNTNPSHNHQTRLKCAIFYPDNAAIQKFVLKEKWRSNASNHLLW